jgi:hypothetical protein
MTMIGAAAAPPCMSPVGRAVHAARQDGIPKFAHVVRETPSPVESANHKYLAVVWQRLGLLLGGALVRSRDWLRGALGCARILRQGRISGGVLLLAY